MANIKFSAFTNEAVDVAATELVGYKVGDTSANYRYSIAQLATALSSSIPTIYSADGTLSAARTVAMDGNDLTFSGGSGVYPVFNIGDITLYPNGQNASAYPGKNSMQVRGLIRFPYYGAASPGLSWESYNTSVKAYGFTMYGGGAWSHNSGYSVIGPDFDFTSGADLTARLGVIGVHNDNTSYAFRVQNSDLTDIFSVNNDTTTTVEKNLVIKGQGYTELHAQTSNDLQFNWNDSNIQTATGLTGSHTFTASNPKAGATYILTLAQTGTVTATWTGVSWPGGTAPTLSGNTKTDVVTLICYDATGAGLYYGSATLDLA